MMGNCLEISAFGIGSSHLSTLQKRYLRGQKFCYLRDFRRSTVLLEMDVKGQCKVCFITWPLQNVTGKLHILSLYANGSTLFIQQI